jgi:hypothetical protein
MTILLRACRICSSTTIRSSNSPPVYIEQGHNAIGCKGLHAFAQMLLENHFIAEIDFVYNYIRAITVLKTKGLYHWPLCFQKIKTSLKFILVLYNVGNNSITNIGLNSLGKAIRKNKALVQLHIGIRL